MPLKRGDVVVHREDPPVYTAKMLFYVERIDPRFGVQVSQVTSNIELSANHWFPAAELHCVGHVKEDLARSKEYGHSHARSFLPRDMDKFDSAKRVAIASGWKLDPLLCK